MAQPLVIPFGRDAPEKDNRLMLFVDTRVVLDDATIPGYKDVPHFPAAGVFDRAEDERAFVVDSLFALSHRHRWCVLCCQF